MRSVARLFLILITLTTIIYAWLTHQLGNPRTQMLIAILIVTTFAVFLVLNLLDHREERKRRKESESRERGGSEKRDGKIKRPDGSFALKERKSGLRWGGGNIRASEATRGTKRMFLGR